MKETQIIAYALNELQREDRDNFESGLAADEGLQGELQSVTRVADALEQIMAEPSEGLEPRAREGLLRAMAANQEAFRSRRKIVRFAVPVSLAAAASIAVLLWVAGGTIHQGPAVAADGAAKGDFTLRGSGELSSSAASLVTSTATNHFRVNGIQTARSAGRTISMSESARVAQELRDNAGLSLTSPAVRMKPLIWDEDATRLGSTGGQR